MNKTLIAMAVAGVMAAPMAAQADATVYGKIHVSIDSGDTGGQDSADGTLKSSGLYFQSNSGRIGFKGSEDLGGNLKAVWKFESNASFGSGNTSFGGRNSYVGLAGGWGSIVGGRHDTPFKTVGRKFDLFGDYVGDSRNLIQRGTGSANWDLRPGNVVAYTMPSIGGFDARVAYVIDDAVDNNTALSAYGMFKLSNWLFALGYESQDNDTGTSSDGLRAGVQWAPGAFKLNAFYQTTSDEGGVSGADASAMGLGAGFKMGKSFLKAQYYMLSNDTDGVNDADAATMAIGWDYNMSKRSTVYVAYATTDNDAGAYYGVDRGGHGGELWAQSGEIGRVNGDDPSILSFGMIHKF